MVVEDTQTSEEGVLAQLLARPDGVPPWLASLVMHLLFMIALGICYVAPPVGSGGDFVLNCEASSDADDMGLAGGDPGGLSQAIETSVSADGSETLAVEPPLPDLLTTSAASAADPEIDQSVASLLNNGAGHGEDSDAMGAAGAAAGNGNPLGGLRPGRTKLYGVPATGTKFVYVLDHSESMGFVYYYNSPEDGVPRASVPMESAKEQLMSSVDLLKRDQRFQIVFYNHQPFQFQFGTARGKLLQASREVKQRAKAFVSETYPSGGTNHFDALAMALSLKPDVVFLLTDGEEKDDPTPLQLKQVRQLNDSHAAIHVIQFVQSPRPTSTLVRLAEDNNGRHVFIDITRVGGWAK